MRRHLLVTNDFPPKVGGIQNYLWELWRRLEPSATSVYCTPHGASAAFDRDQGFSIRRSREPWLLPSPWLVRRVRRLAADTESDLVLLDPALPLGFIGPFLGIPYGVVLHGAEVTIPARLPVLRSIMARVLRGASLVVAAGDYALTEAQRCVDSPLPGIVVPPGVDLDRFVPPTAELRSAARSALDLGPSDLAVGVVTRLVPRKGMHTLVEAAAELGTRYPDLVVLIGGGGRQSARLQTIIERSGARARLLGRLDDADVVRLYQAIDVMAMPCQRRWWGLEQEGFGIVFLEAAACGIPQIAGRSGGAAEAVEHGVTGLVVDEPESVQAVAAALAVMLADPEGRRRMGVAARRQVEASFGYDHLASTLQAAVDAAHLNSPSKPKGR